MRLVVIMLALVPILGYRASAPKPMASAEIEEIWHLILPEVIRVELARPCVVEADGSWWVGATKIPLGNFDPTEPGHPGSLSEVYDPDCLPE